MRQPTTSGARAPIPSILQTAWTTSCQIDVKVVRELNSVLNTPETSTKAGRAVSTRSPTVKHETGPTTLSRPHRSPTAAVNAPAPRWVQAEEARSLAFGVRSGREVLGGWCPACITINLVGLASGLSDRH